MTFESTMEDIARGFEAAGVAVLITGRLIAFGRPLVPSRLPDASPRQSAVH